MNLVSQIRFAVVVSLALAMLAINSQAQPIRVELKRSNDGAQLFRDGKPYFIKGAGGGGSKELLAQLGGNSFRTWGVADDTQRQLDEAQKLGLTVTLGIWLGHEDQGFSYQNEKQVAQQYEQVHKAILKYKD